MKTHIDNTIEEIEYLRAVIPNMPLSKDAIKSIMDDINKLENKVKAQSKRYADERVREFANDLIETFSDVVVDPKDAKDETVIVEGFAIDMALSEMSVSIINECLKDFLNQNTESEEGCDTNKQS